MAAFKAKQINQQNHTVTTFITYQDCLAKTCRLSDGTAIAGRGVFEHCVIVGEVAKQLLALMANSDNKAIVLRAEKSVPHEKVVKVMEIAYRNQIKMVIAVNPK